MESPGQRRFDQTKVSQPASKNLFTICSERLEALEGPPERCPRDPRSGMVCCGGPQAARQPGGQCAAPGSPPSQSEADLLRPARRSAGTGAYLIYVRIPSTA